MATETREGDWNCPKCDDLVFSFRTTCRTCGTDKAVTMENSKNGDWMCPNKACGELVFANRHECYKCGTMKGGDGKGGKGKGKGKGGDDWICPNRDCGDLVFATRDECRKCGARKPRMNMYDSYGRGDKMGMDNFRRGGRMDNYGRDDDSMAVLTDLVGQNPRMGNALLEAAVQLLQGGGGQGGGRFDNRREMDYGRERRPVERSMRGPEFGGRGKGGRNSNFSAGDWECVECGDHQFARNKECRQCKAPKPDDEVPTNGDWVCPNTDCADYQFARNDECRKCGEPKPSNVTRSGNYGGDRGRQGSFKDGDWECQDCGDHQFARNTKCRKCGCPKRDGSRSRSR